MTVRRGPRMRGGWPALSCVLAALGACDRGTSPSILRVAAAASLRELVTDCEAAFCATAGASALVASFDASSTLARQIQAGAAIDVFLASDQATVTRVAEHLVPGSEVVFLRNRLVVVGAADLANPPRNATELTEMQGRLALAAPAVPAGRYARTWLSTRGVLPRLEPKIVNADNVRAALALVESGAAAAAVVYATDARIASRARVLFEVALDEDPGVVHVAAAVRGGREPLASAFLLWLGSEAFLTRAKQRGFLPPR